MVKVYRHLDQVERSPKAKQYCTTILLSPCLLQSIFSLLTLIFPYFTQIPKQLSNQTPAFLDPNSTSHFFSPFIFYLPLFFFIVVIICYIYKFLLFFTFTTTSQHQLGDLSTSLEMTVLFLVVISTK